jgi:hypothetical protein
MIVNNDPVGEAVKRYYEYGDNTPLNVFSDITQPDVIPVEYFFRTFDDMPEIERFALKRAYGKILDVGAAAGAHAVWLQNNNKDVTALEQSSLAVDIMKKRGVKNAVCEDFYRFNPETEFNTLLFLMNGTGIAGDLNNLHRFLNKCRSLLSKEGCVLIDSSDLSYMFDMDDLPQHYYGEVNYIMEYKSIISKKFKWLFLDFDTLKNYVLKTGGECNLLVNGPHYDYLAELRW